MSRSGAMVGWCVAACLALPGIALVNAQSPAPIPAKPEVVPYVVTAKVVAPIRSACRLAGYRASTYRFKCGAQTVAVSVSR